MPDNFTIQIDGIRELSDLLTEQTPVAAKRYLSKVAEPAATVVLNALRETVPVQVGVLEEALGWQKKWLDGEETTMDMRIGPLKFAFWGSFQEFGTSDVVGIDKSGRKFHHAAEPGQHWMGRAWEGCKARVFEVFLEGAQEMIAKLKMRKGA